MHKENLRKISIPSSCLKMGVLQLLFPLVSLLIAASSLGDIPTSENVACSTNLLPSNVSGILLPLHHVQGPCSPLHGQPPTAMWETLRQDELRVQYLLSRLRGAATGEEWVREPDSISVPVESGGQVGTGNFVVRVGIGSPPRDYVMVADTGSTFTWLQCQPCTDYCHPQVGTIFDPAASSTYQSVPCGDPTCTNLQEATLNPSHCSSQNKCLYQASYGDRSLSMGYLSRDTLTVGTAALEGFLYGCGKLNQGLFGRTARLIGLSRDSYSLSSQLGSKYGNVFSYCLPTPSSTGSLSFGDVGNPSDYQYTPMHTSSKDQSLYFLRLTGITLAGSPLAALTSSDYSTTPTLIESGTVITRLPGNVYAALKEAFQRATAGYPTAPAFSLLGTCLSAAAKDVAVPEVVVFFDGGTQLRLEPWNVLMDVGDEGTSCLAFAGNSNSDGVAIIGNRQQQRTTVVYDVSNSRIGFASGGCG